MARPEIVIATKNRGKVAEFRQIMEELGLPDAVDLKSLSDFPDYPDVIESGATFEENALIKARAAASHTGLLSAADDSGIEVEALNGAPGVLSARFAGPGATDAANNEKLLAELSGVAPEKRAARFVAVIALVGPTGERPRCGGSAAARSRRRQGAPAASGTTRSFITRRWPRPMPR